MKIGTIGIAGCLGLSLTLYCIIIDAFLRGGQTTIYINEFGEGLLEIIIVPIIIVIGLIDVLKNMKESHDG